MHAWIVYLCMHIHTYMERTWVNSHARRILHIKCLHIHAYIAYACMNSLCVHACIRTYMERTCANSHARRIHDIKCLLWCHTLEFCPYLRQGNNSHLAWTVCMHVFVYVCGCECMYASFSTTSASKEITLIWRELYVCIICVYMYVGVSSES